MSHFVKARHLFFCFFSHCIFYKKLRGNKGCVTPTKCSWQLCNTPHTLRQKHDNGWVPFLTVPGSSAAPPTSPTPKTGGQELPQISLKSVALKHRHATHMVTLTICTTNDSSGERESGSLWRDEQGLEEVRPPSSLQASSILWPLAMLPLYQLSPQCNCIDTGRRTTLEATVLALETKNEPPTHALRKDNKKLVLTH